MAGEGEQELIIAEIYGGGAAIRMLDGSEWQLADEDSSVTSGWLPGDEVIVRPLDGAAAKVEMVNGEDVVRAAPA